jgi:oligosaccharide repeat unit polymerase
LVLPAALGLTAGAPPTWIRSPHVDTALWLFSIATVAFTLGARLRAPSAAARQDAAPATPSDPHVFWVGGAIALLGATLLWIGVVQLGIMTTTYWGFFQRSATEDVRFFGFGLMLFPIGLLAAAGGATPRRMPALGALLLVTLGPLFWQGFRGPFIVNAAAFLAVLMAKKPRVARPVAAAALAAAMILAPAIRQVRDRGDEVRVQKVDPLEFLLEAGGSLYPLVVTAERVESGFEPLWLGRSYAKALGRIVPNVSRRPDRDPREMRPSVWVTMKANRWTYEHGGGIGFSGVAEPYLNFGIAGVVLFFLLLGFLIDQSDRWLVTGPFRAAFAAACYGFILWTARNDAMEVFRALVLAGGTVIAARLISRSAGGELRGLDARMRSGAAGG